MRWVYMAHEGCGDDEAEDVLITQVTMRITMTVQLRRSIWMATRAKAGENDNNLNIYRFRIRVKIMMRLGTSRRIYIRESLSVAPELRITKVGSAPSCCHF